MTTVIARTCSGVAAIAVLFAFSFAPLAANATTFDALDTSFTNNFSDLGTSLFDSLKTDGESNTHQTSGDSSSSYTHTKVECKITANFNEVAFGESVTISWVTSGLSSITINGETISGNSGSKTFTNITENTLFTLIGQSSKGSTCTAKVTVKCLPPPPPPAPQPECTLAAHPTYVNKGSASTLTWTTKHADAVTISSLGTVALNGSQSTGALHSDASYTLTATGNGKEVKCHANVKVKKSHPVPPSCPITPAPGRIIVDFNNFLLRSDDSNNHRTQLYPVTIPDGTYSVRLVAYDGYIGRDETTAQPKEQYKVTFFNTNGGVVTSSGITSDLPDGVVEATVNEQVNGSLSLTGAAGLRGVHAFMGDSSSPNSVRPICVALDPKSTPPPPPKAPECPFTDKPGRTIINFDNVRLRTDQGASNAFSPIVNVAFPAAHYTIQLASWDGYLGRENVSQPNEQWKLEFMNGNTVVGASNAIGDLQDNVVSAFKQEQVNSNYSLATAATGVRAAHPFYPTNASANSLNPICAALDEKPKDPAPICDSFTATPATIKVGQSAVLNWNTTNATRVVINNGIGEVAATGTVSVTPLANTTYTLTVFGVNNQSATCSVPVTVTEKKVPVCESFTANPTQVPFSGGTTTLSWSVKDAASVSIAPTVGVVSQNGTAPVFVSSNTTFILTATSTDGETVSCPAIVTRQPAPEVFTCANNVTFSATNSSIRRGNSTALNWNVQNADSVSISVINATSLVGTQTVSPNDSTTYVLRATKGTKTVDCPVSVVVTTGGGGGGSPSPRCELTISDRSITRGEEITLRWDTRLATEITIKDDRGNIIVTTEDKLSRDKDDLFKGSIKLTPTRNTTYTLVAERGSREDECSVKVEMDNLTILQSRDQQPLVAGISLSSVPHTGFEAGPFMTFMFYALLVAWALYITYLIVLRKRGEAVAVTVTPNIASMKQAETIRPDVFVPVASTAVATPTNLPTGTPVIGYASAVAETVNPHQVNDVVITELENRAHEQRALLSSDAVRYFIATTEGVVERNEALDAVIAEAKKSYPLEDGWMVINESRMQNLCTVCQVNAVQASSSPFVPATVPQGSSSLAEAIVTGNIVAAYEMIGKRPMFALADAAADLDAVYRNRRGESKSISDLLARESATISDEKIKAMIAALTSALDGTYTDEASAVKMAIMKAVKELH